MQNDSVSWLVVHFLNTCQQWLLLWTSERKKKVFPFSGFPFHLFVSFGPLSQHMHTHTESQMTSRLMLPNSFAFQNFRWWSSGGLCVVVRQKCKLLLRLASLCTSMGKPSICSTSVNRLDIPPTQEVFLKMPELAFLLYAGYSVCWSCKVLQHPKGTVDPKGSSRLYPQSINIIYFYDFPRPCFTTSN